MGPAEKLPSHPPSPSLPLPEGISAIYCILEPVLWTRESTGLRRLWNHFEPCIALFLPTIPICMLWHLSLPGPWSRTLCNYELHLLFSLHPPTANWTMKTELTPALHLWPGSTIYRAPGWGFLAGPQWWMQNSYSCTTLDIQTVKLIFLPQGQKKKASRQRRTEVYFPSKNPAWISADGSLQTLFLLELFTMEGAVYTLIYYQPPWEWSLTSYSNSLHFLNTLCLIF